MAKISVIGSGSWGLALSNTLVQNDHQVLVWSFFEDEVNEINNEHKAKKYFKEMPIDERIKASTDLEEVLNFSDIILMAIPTKFYRNTLTSINQLLTTKKLFINASKGIEPGTYKLIDEIIKEEISEDHLQGVVIFTGPSHAEELIINQITLITSASENIEDAKLVQELFSNNFLRVYASTDTLGAQLGSSLKNVIALASGCCAGLGFGDNTRAALITRGLTEMVRYAEFKGANKETMYGLTGLGDLVVTATSVHSRNYQAGYRIGQGEDPQESVSKSVMVVEGIRTAKAVVEQLKDTDIEMPIFESVYDIFYNNIKVEDAIKRLMTRELKIEQI
jgi:glycerol-3-phosphate dehydrogenase (NAD(P)+)